MTSAPAPPVSRWERLAAGVLVLMLGVSLYGRWLRDGWAWLDLPGYAADMQQGWRALFAMRSLRLSEWVENGSIVSGVYASIWLGVLLGTLAILPLSTGRALGWHWPNLRRSLWWLVLAHGSLPVVAFTIGWFLSSLGADQTIDLSKVRIGLQSLWELWSGSPWPFIHFAEFLLAVAVLVLTRRKTSQGLPGSV